MNKINLLKIYSNSKQGKNFNNYNILKKKSFLRYLLFFEDAPGFRSINYTLIVYFIRSFSGL